MCITRSNHRKKKKMHLIGSCTEFLPYPRDHHFTGLQASKRENLCSSVLQILQEGSGLCTHKVLTSLLITVLTPGRIYIQIVLPTATSLGKSEKPTSVNMKCTVMVQGKYIMSCWLSNLYTDLILALNFRLSNPIVWWTFLPECPPNLAGLKSNSSSLLPHISMTGNLPVYRA